MKALRSLFPNALWIARREYLVRVRSRSFVVSTIVLALVTFAVVLAPIVIQDLSQGARVRIAVYEATTNLPADTMLVLDRSLFGAPAGGDTAGTGREFQLQLASDLGAAQSDLQAGRINGLLLICRADAAGHVGAPCSSPVAAASAPQANDLVFEYRADIAPNGRQAYYVRLAANALVFEDRAARAGVNAGALVAPAQLAVVNPKTETAGGGAGNGPARSDEEEVSRVLTATALIILIFIVVITYGTWVAMSVAEEKSSRVMELMLSAASPIQMLTGKVIGNGLAGFTQYLAILIAGGVALVAQGWVAAAVLGDGGGNLPFGGLSVPILLTFGMFFVLGFLLYALLYAAAGSMVSRQEDVQQAAMPLMMISMVGYFGATVAIQDINAPWVAVLSFVPFFSPYLMLARVLLTTVAPWELVVAVLLLLATIGLALWVAARIYSAGVLLYGQRASLRKIVSAARVAR